MTGELGVMVGCRRGRALVLRGLEHIGMPVRGRRSILTDMFMATTSKGALRVRGEGAFLLRVRRVSLAPCGNRMTSQNYCQTASVQAEQKGEEPRKVL